jgi:hypothetical protein
MKPISPEQFEAARSAVHKNLIDRLMETRGKRKPETLHAIASRGYLLRLGARLFYPDLPECQQAETLRIIIRRYSTGRWRRHRNEPSCPEAIRGTVYEVAFCVLRQQDRAPGFSTIKNALRRKY